MPIHVSVHDVSPAWAVEIELALDFAHRAGAKPALLVVPNFHGRAPLLEAAPFCARLRKLQTDGHEVFLHGFFHKSREAPTRDRSDGRPSRLAWLFAQRVASGGEAEFADLSRAEAAERLEEGEHVLKEAGLRVDGFVAPAWSMPSWLMGMLAERGCTYTEDHLSVYDPRAGRSRTSIVFNFASRTPARLVSSVAFCRAATPLGALMPARIALHPGDMHYALLRKEAERLLDWGKGSFVPRARDLL